MVNRQKERRQGHSTKAGKDDDNNTPAAESKGSGTTNTTFFFESVSLFFLHYLSLRLLFY